MTNESHTKLSIAYAAGIFDGEGSLAIYLGSGRYRRALVFAVSIWQNDERLLDWFKDRFGGGVYRRRANSYGKRTPAEWRATTCVAADFLKVIRPHLIVRAEDVDEILKIWENRFDRPLLEELIQKRRSRLDQKRIDNAKTKSICAA